jgi:hypothetical protein
MKHYFIWLVAKKVFVGPHFWLTKHYLNRVTKSGVLQGGREVCLARIAELVAIASEDPALGVTQGARAPVLPARPRAPGAKNGKSAPTKRVAYRAASSPCGEPSC